MKFKREGMGVWIFIGILILLNLFLIGFVMTGMVFEETTITDTGVTTESITTGGDLNLSGVLFVDGTNGRVGIGTASPGEKLDVVGSLSIKPSIGDERGGIIRYRVVGDATDGIYFDTYWSSDHGWRTGMMIQAHNGRVGIGVTLPYSKLHVNGTLTIGGGSSQKNITLTSPNANEWCCGVGNTGLFTCSPGTCS